MKLTNILVAAFALSVVSFGVRADDHKKAEKKDAATCKTDKGEEGTLDKDGKCVVVHKK